MNSGIRLAGTSSFLSLESYAEALIADFLERCTACGSCMEFCPIHSYSNFAKLDSQEIRSKFNAFLKDGSEARNIAGFLKVCIKCRHCSRSCPEGLDPFLILDMIKPRLKKLGLFSDGAPNDGPYIYLPDNKYNFMRVMAALQTLPSEKRWLTEMPSNPTRVDVLFFPSCGEVAFPDRLFAKIDILEAMGINFVTLGPYENEACCGVAHLMAGSYEKAERTSRDLLGKIERFNPETVIVGCPSSYRWINDVVPHFRPYSFRFQHYFRFVSENMHLLKLKPLNYKVTVHDPCPLARGVQEWEAPRKILQNIPGIKIVEMKRTREQAPCCGENVPESLPEVSRAMRRERLGEAVATGADVLATVCAACDYNYSKDAGHFQISVRNLLSILIEALGIKLHENKIPCLRSLGNVDRVLEECSDTIKANGYTIEELRKPVNRYLFGVPM